MDDKLMRAISDFVTQRMNDLGAEASDAVTVAITETERINLRMADALSPEQAPLFRQLENALILQAGEEARFYYRAGFNDAVRFILDWNSEQ